MNKERVKCPACYGIDADPHDGECCECEFKVGCAEECNSPIPPDVGSDPPDVGSESLCQGMRGKQRALVAHSAIDGRPVIISASCGIVFDLQESCLTGHDVFQYDPASDDLWMWEGNLVHGPEGPDYIGNWIPFPIEDRGENLSTTFTCKLCDGKGHMGGGAVKTKTLPRWLEIDCDRCGKKFYATRTREKEVKVGAELMCEGCQSYQDGYDEGYAHGLEDGSNKMGFKPRVWTDTEVKKIRKNAKKLAKKLAPNGIDHEEKINWMAIWCAKNGALLNLNGEIGLGRECVGISVNGNYAEYEWHDSELTRIDENGGVWCPEDALRPYVAVLGRGEKAESQLYDWLKWFDDEGFNLETSMSLDDIKNPIQLFIGKRHKVRMVRRK